LFCIIKNDYNNDLFIITLYNMNSENQRSLFQRAGEIIVNKYNNIKNIPDKYLFFYKKYIPLSIGQKRKYEDDSIV